MKPLHVLVLFCLCTAALGCGKAELGRKSKTAEAKKKVAWAKGSEAAEKEIANSQVQKKSREKSRAVPLEHATLRESAFRGGGGSFSSSGGSYTGPSRSDSQAIAQVKTAVQQSLEVGPTLLVWLVDRSDSASRLITSTLTAARTFCDEPDFVEAAKDEKLLSAVIGFGEKTDLLLDPPTADLAAVKDTLNGVKTEAGTREATFASVKLALEKYIPLRTREHREVVMVVITDEPGDDGGVAEDAIALARKHTIPIYVVGPTVPLGKLPASDMKASNPSGDKRTEAFDVPQADMISMEYWSGGYGATDVVDSGFGPFLLERLARESGGAFLGVGAVGGQRFDPAVMKNYAPSYGSLMDYEKQVSENKCRQALVQASKMETAKALRNQQYSFPKQNNEARNKQMLDKAQLDAARLEPEVNKIFEALSAGEADRAKLTGARWQVAYDLAMGRAAAAKVRIDGYNAMLAALKRGKTFEKEGSNTWIIEPADSIETGSAQQKLADKAKIYLTRVKEEHKGTPWAKFADDELRTPLGWKWSEQ